jgi:hypothetical protein
MFLRSARSLRYHRGSRRIPARAFAYAAEAALSMILLSAGGWAFLRYISDSKTFEPKVINVEGEHVLSEQAIRDAALRNGRESLIRMDTSAIAANVRSLPYVKTCQVARMFPDTLLLTVEERVPVAALVYDSHLFAIDYDGVVLRDIALTETFDGPLITNVPELNLVEPGVAIEQKPLRHALSVWQSFSQSGAAKVVTVSELSVERKDTVEMICEDLPYEILWSPDEIDAQVLHLDVLFNEHGPDGLGCEEYLDLRFGKDIPCR